MNDRLQIVPEYRDFESRKMISKDTKSATKKTI